MEQITQNTKIISTQINTLISELNGKLNLSGGTLTGTLQRSGIFCKGTTDTSELVIFAGTDFSKGSGIHLYGKDSTSENKGRAILWSCDTSGNRKYLQLMPDGTATINGQSIITSNFKGCSSSSDGSKGLVPAPWKGIEESFLCANGSWAYPNFLGEKHLSTEQDFNTVTKTGVYRFNTNHPNMPSGYDWGQLFVGHGGGDTIFQFVVGYSAGCVYPAIRCGNPPDIGGAGQWTSWFKCSLMDMNNRTTYPNGTQLWIA